MLTQSLKRSRPTVSTLLEAVWQRHIASLLSRCSARLDGIDVRAILAKRVTNSLRLLLIHREKTRICSRVYGRAQWCNSDRLSPGVRRDNYAWHDEANFADRIASLALQWARVRGNSRPPSDNEGIDWYRDNVALFIYSFHPIPLCAIEKDVRNLHQGSIQKDTNVIASLCRTTHELHAIDIGNFDGVPERFSLCGYTTTCENVPSF